MSDPYRPGQSGWQGAEPTEPATHRYPPYSDPAYAGQTPTYGSGYPPAYASSPDGHLSQQPWSQGQQPPNQPPSTAGEPPPPEPPKSPKWLWLLAGAAVLLVVGLVIALVLANGSANKSATVSPVPSTPSTKAGTRAPTTTGSPGATTTAPPTSGTSPTETPGSGAAESVVYEVTGQGRAISIIYLDADGVVQTEFNVPLPWSKEVSLTSSASQPPSLTVANIGEEVTCSVTVNGAQVSQRTGSLLTVCSGSR